MAHILVRNVEEDVARRMKEKAAAKGISLNEVAREAPRKDMRPTREELIERARRIRAMSSYSDLDSTARLALDLEHPIYDCVYLALAVREGVPIVTADERLIAMARLARVEARLL